MTTKSKNWMAVRSSILTAASGFRTAAQQIGIAPAPEKNYTGTVAAIDPKEHVLNVRGWTRRRKSFNLSDHCECSQLENKRAAVDDLRPGEKVTVRYLKVEGVRIAVRVEQQPMRLHGMIRKLDAESRTLTLHQKPFDHELRWTDDCEIILHDDQPGTIADLEIGNQVTVTYEAPDNVLTGRRIEQTSIQYAGTLIAIDLDDKMVKAKSLSGVKKFSVAANCAVLIYGRLDGRLEDLRPEDKLIVSYDEINGVNIANRIAVVEIALETLANPLQMPPF